MCLSTLKTIHIKISLTNLKIATWNSLSNGMRETEEFGRMGHDITMEVMIRKQVPRKVASERRSNRKILFFIGLSVRLAWVRLTLG